MKSGVFRIGVWALVLGQCIGMTRAIAKEPVSEKGQETASILFVNVVQDPGLAFLTLDGVDANPAGFQAGLVTGWVQFPAGERAIEVEHQPLGKVALTKSLEAGSRQAFVAYKVLEDQSASGRPLRPTIGVLTMACEEKGKVAAGKRRVVLVNTTMREEMVLDVGGETVTLKRLKPKTVTADMGGGFIVVKPILGKAAVEPGAETSAGESEMVSLATLNVEEPVESYVIVHETAEGGLAAVTFTGLSSGEVEE